MTRDFFAPGIWYIIVEVPADDLKGRRTCAILYCIGEVTDNAKLSMEIQKIPVEEAVKHGQERWKVFHTKAAEDTSKAETSLI